MLVFLFALVSSGYYRRRIRRNVPNSATGVVYASTLNVRDGPSMSSNKIGYLSKGDKVIILDTVDSWYKITFNNGYGYVLSDYIVLDSSTEIPDYPTYPIRAYQISSDVSDMQKVAGFLCACYCGGISTESEIQQIYTKALSKGAIYSDYRVKDWNKLAQIAGKAKSGVASLSPSIKPSDRQREILYCPKSDNTYHYVVADGSNIIFDPIFKGYVSYSDCQSKIIFTY